MLRDIDGGRVCTSVWGGWGTPQPELHDTPARALHQHLRLAGVHLGICVLVKQGS